MSRTALHYWKGQQNIGRMVDYHGSHRSCISVDGFASMPCSTYCLIFSHLVSSSWLKCFFFFIIMNWMKASGKLNWKIQWWHHLKKHIALITDMHNVEKEAALKYCKYFLLNFNFLIHYEGVNKTMLRVRRGHLNPEVFSNEFCGFLWEWHWSKTSASIINRIMSCNTEKVQFTHNCIASLGLRDVSWWNIEFWKKCWSFPI